MTGVQTCALPISMRHEVCCTILFGSVHFLFGCCFSVIMKFVVQFYSVVFTFYLDVAFLESQCLLVKGWKGTSWSFPRGKKNKDEEDHTCAIREVRMFSS